MNEQAAAAGWQAVVMAYIQTLYTYVLLPSVHISGTIERTTGCPFVCVCVCEREREREREAQ